jgi:hypothetical protein
VTGFETWTPDPSVNGVLRSSSVVRTTGAYLFILAGSLYIWVTSTDRTTAGIAAVLQLSLISSIAGFRARVPRRAQPADYDSRALQFLAKSMRLPCPAVRVIDRDGQSVRLRGRTRQPTILLSPLSLLTWQRDPIVHSVQMAHEMGHLWARDLSRLYFLSTGVVLLTIEVIPFAARNRSSDLLLILVAALGALLSLRSFLRAREIGADFLAAQVLGANARDVLPDTDVAEREHFHFWQAHPSPSYRRKAFDEPSMLYADLRLPFFAFGYSCALALDMLSAGYRIGIGGGRTGALQVALFPTSVVVALVVGRLLACGAFLAPARQRKTWFRSFLVGALLCLSLLTHTVVSVTTAVFLIGVLVAARLLAPLADVIFALIGQIERTYAWRHRFAQAIAPTAAWAALIESYYFWHTRI